MTPLRAGDESCASDPVLGDLRFVSAERISLSSLPHVVLDYPLSVNHSLEFLIETTGHRSLPGIRLILRNGNEEQRGGAGRPWPQYPRVASWFSSVPRTDKPGRCPMKVLEIANNTARTVETAARATNDASDFPRS